MIFSILTTTEQAFANSGWGYIMAGIGTLMYNVAKVYLNIFGYWMQNCHACCHLNKMFIKFTRGQQKDHQQNR